jgi:hypothetical protein
MIDDQEERSMQPRTCLSSALTLSACVAFGTAAIGADLPKAGTYKATWASSSPIEVIPAGKERIFIVWTNEIGQTVSDGFLDHVTWRCWGMGDHTKGVGQDHGSCVATDPSGDQLVDDWKSEDYTFGQKIIKLTDRFTSGTGKYAGITGGGTSTIDTGFHAPEGTFVIRGEMQGSYTLPGP